VVEFVRIPQMASPVPTVGGGVQFTCEAKLDQSYKAQVTNLLTPLGWQALTNIAGVPGLRRSSTDSSPTRNGLIG